MKHPPALAFEPLLASRVKLRVQAPGKLEEMFYKVLHNVLINVAAHERTSKLEELVEFEDGEDSLA